MNDSGRTISVSAQELRRTFDESFAAPAVAPAADLDDYLTIRVGNGHYAIKTSDLSGLEVSRKVVAVPTSAPSLMGIAGVGGQLVPVYRLGQLLGHEDDHQNRWWLAIVGVDQPIALAIEELEGHIRLARADVHAPVGEGESRRYLGKALRVEAGIRHIVDVESIVTAIRNQSGNFAAAGK
jgi:purine-binding chemotaxis protein CheW